MKSYGALLTTCVFVLAAWAVLVPCTQPLAGAFEPPVYYDEAKVAEASGLITKGYELLDGGDLDGALATFAEVGQLVPCGLAQEYHSACALSRTGNKDGALRWLEQLVKNGYDSVENLTYDPDFENLRDDPRFDNIVAKAEENYEKGSAVFTSGLPDGNAPADTINTEDELNDWVRRQNRRNWSYQSFWTSVQQLAAQIDVTASYLAKLKILKTGDPEFDYGLERVRAAYRLKSIFMPGWGVVTDIVLQEVEAYKNTSPPAEKIDQVNYFAGTALSLKYGESDDRRAGTFEKAGTYYKKIGKESNYYGAAHVSILVDRYKAPGADKKAVGLELKKIIQKYPGDEDVYAAVSSRVNHDAVSLLWPIPLEATDLDGKKVTLREYAGKVVLLDFWATWCGPCRAELPGLTKVYEEFHPRGLEILSISLDYPSRTSNEAYREWIATNKMNWRHVYDGKGWDSELVKNFFIGSIPATFLVGPDGSLVAWGEDCRGDKLSAAVSSALGD